MLSLAGRACFAADAGEAPPQTPLRPEIRSGGVIEESYVYHRQQTARMASAARSVEPAGGWYGYGFPVSTFRWGWFGAVVRVLCVGLALLKIITLIVHPPGA
jgi:hypothetical protein